MYNSGNNGAGRNRKAVIMPKYLFWRGRSLWCRFPLPGHPMMYPMGIKTTGAGPDKLRCLRDGETKLAALRTRAMEGTLFEKTVEQAPYNPKYWRLVGRYWYHHLRYQKSCGSERFHLLHSLRQFGPRYASEITRDNVEHWRQSMIADGASVNTVNLRTAYLNAAFKYAMSESDSGRRLSYNPMTGMKKIAGGRIRSFLLTVERFERNHKYLLTGEKYQDGEEHKKHSSPWKCPPDPRFALFYLSLWELGRRPLEVSQYTWEMVNTMEIDGEQVHIFSVPPEIAKTAEYDNVVISDRLWDEMRQLAYRTGIVFRNAEGRRWKHWSKHKEKLEKAFGADAGWIRDCRRGYVTYRTEVVGDDPYHVRMQSGHRTSSIFDRYRIGQLRNQLKVVQSPSKHTNFIHLAKSG